MTRTCYINGRYAPSKQAAVSMWDRGYQLADGVYEVIVFFNRIPLDADRHLARLRDSLAALGIAPPMSDAALRLVVEELIARNGYRDGLVYIQVTRGTALRNHLITKGMKPNLTMAVLPVKLPTSKDIAEGIPVTTANDIRWKRCDVKSIALLANVLARNEAAVRGGREVFLVDDEGRVTEGSASNAYIVKAGKILTHPADHAILNGVRRRVLIALAKKHGMKLEERAFSLKEALAADEAFLTSASSTVLPVTSIDGKKIGSGKPGPVTKKILMLYREHVTKQTGKTWEHI